MGRQGVIDKTRARVHRDRMRYRYIFDQLKGQLKGPIGEHYAYLSIIVPTCSQAWASAALIEACDFSMARLGRRVIVFFKAL